MYWSYTMGSLVRGIGLKGAKRFGTGGKGGIKFWFVNLTSGEGINGGENPSKRGT